MMNEVVDGERLNEVEARKLKQMIFFADGPTQNEAGKHVLGIPVGNQPISYFEYYRRPRFVSY